MRVLVTQASGTSRRVRSMLEAHGATILELPSIAIAPPEDPAPLDEAIRCLATYDWIVFASRNGVSAFCRQVNGPLPRGIRVAAVGPSTAALLEEHGIQVDCMPEEARGTALVQALTEAGIAGKRILLPAGNRSRPELRQGLEAAGATVNQIVVYRTVLPSKVDAMSLEALRTGQVDVVALASPSAAENLLALLGDDASGLARARLVCIGPTTAAAIRDLGFEPAAVADPHTAEGMAGAILSLEEIA